MRFKSGQYVSAESILRQTPGHVIAGNLSFASLMRPVVATVFALGLAGCSGIHLSELQGTATPPPAPPAPVAAVHSAPGAITGSIGSTASLGYADADHTDWDTVLTTINASLSAPPTSHIEWSNKTTGDSGTISDLTAMPDRKPRDCRAFSTTIASVDGVHLYHAEICKSFMNTWEFAKLVAADAG